MSCFTRSDVYRWWNGKLYIELGEWRTSRRLRPYRLRAKWDDLRALAKERSKCLKEPVLTGFASFEDFTRWWRKTYV